MLLKILLPCLLITYHVVDVTSFTLQPRITQSKTHLTNLQMSTPDSDIFSITFDLPPTGNDLKAQLNFKPVLPQPSEIVIVRYKLPFGLDVSPQKGLAICNKAGTGGEQPGDALRFTSFWTFGLPNGDGILTTAASFSGGIQWQCRMFDVMKATRWEDVVEALTSNVESRTDEVVLVFERATQQSE